MGCSFKDARVGGAHRSSQGLESGVRAGIGAIAPAGVAPVCWVGGHRAGPICATRPSVMIWEKWQELPQIMHIQSPVWFPGTMGQNHKAGNSLPPWVKPWVTGSFRSESKDRMGSQEDAMSFSLNSGGLSLKQGFSSKIPWLPRYVWIEFTQELGWE